MPCHWRPDPVWPPGYGAAMQAQRAASRRMKIPRAPSTKLAEQPPLGSAWTGGWDAWMSPCLLPTSQSTSMPSPRASATRMNKEESVPRTTRPAVNITANEYAANNINAATKEVLQHGARSVIRPQSATSVRFVQHSATTRTRPASATLCRVASVCKDTALAARTAPSQRSAGAWDAVGLNHSSAGPIFASTTDPRWCQRHLDSHEDAAQVADLALSVRRLLPSGPATSANGIVELPLRDSPMQRKNNLFLMKALSTVSPPSPPISRPPSSNGRISRAHIQQMSRPSSRSIAWPPATAAQPAFTTIRAAARKRDFGADQVALQPAAAVPQCTTPPTWATIAAEYHQSSAARQQEDATRSVNARLSPRSGYPADQRFTVRS